MFHATNRISGILDITDKTIKDSLGLDVDESYVILAKHSVMGTNKESLCDILGVDLATMEGWELTPEYLQVRAFVAARYAQTLAIQAAGWDDVESLAVQGLAKILKTNNDPDLLLKAAAVANRATRKTKPTNEILDPSKSHNQTVITLTKRMVERLTGASRERAVEESVSITGGRMVSPTFGEVNALLGVDKPAESKPLVERDIDVSDLTDQLLNKGNDS